VSLADWAFRTGVAGGLCADSESDAPPRQGYQMKIVEGMGTKMATFCCAELIVLAAAERGGDPEKKREGS